MKTIKIAEDFSRFPGGRYLADGEGNGTSFRENILVPVLEEHATAEIVLDGTRGYPSSFLEEAFGGLIRKGYSSDLIFRSFKFVANEPGFARFVALIKDHIERAAKAQSEVPG